MLKEEVDEEDIAEVVSKWTHIPVSRLVEGEIQKLLRMEVRLRERVVGQADAIVAVSNAIRRARAGLQDPDRPLGSFIFLGPTGVGKTELARALAEFMFDAEDAMVRIDMSEYQEKHSVARLIGAPPGYVGYEEAGQLTEAIRRRPYAVVLFDEIEKAHPEVLNVMLQLLDDGRLTDSKGRTVDFKNAVVIMTSNLGSQQIAEHGLATGDRGGDDAMRREVERALRAHFRPEFINRVDEIIIFRALERPELVAIVDIQLRQLARRLEDRNVTLELTAAAKMLLVEEGFDPLFGARPLRRTIQRQLLDPLALEILDGTFGAGDRVTADVRDGDLTSPAVRRKAPFTQAAGDTVSASPRRTRCTSAAAARGKGVPASGRRGFGAQPRSAPSKPMRLWLPSQNGLCSEAPQRHRANGRRSTAISSPFASTNVTSSPWTR